MVTRAMTTTPPATRRADTSLTGFGNENRVFVPAARCGELMVDVVMCPPADGYSGRLEGAFEVPHTGEVVERPADDLARPLERVVVRRGVVGAGRSCGVPGPSTARLRRALVEVLPVPRRRQRAQVAAERRAGEHDARERRGGAGLRVILVGRQRERDCEPLLRLHYSVAHGVAGRVERRRRLGLIRAGVQAAVAAGAQGGPGLVGAGRV